MSALSQGLTQRCSRCGRIGRRNRETDGGAVCLPCYADEHACSICGDEQQRRRVVGRSERERLPDLAGYVDVICENCLRVRLQVRGRELAGHAAKDQPRRGGR